MTENRFKKAREQVDFVQDVNSDTQDTIKAVEKVITRNKNEVVIEPNSLTPKQRSRTRHGRNISVPLYVEELEIIEATVGKLSEQHEVSVSNFIRQTLLNRCQEILGQNVYEKLNAVKRNVVK